ncbi:ORF108 [Staphylococcus phage K]|uniref:ORF108 n=1 Tax=Staphylococcus phage K TaxID=221915 RepID=Q6Y7L1_BPPGK|nr:ORF108 [Staphylococcus phage K]
MTEREKLIKDIEEANRDIQLQLKEVDNYKDSIRSKGTRNYISTKVLDSIMVGFIVSFLILIIMRVLEYFVTGNAVYSPLAPAVIIMFVLALGTWKVSKMNKIVSYRGTIKMYWELSNAEQKQAKVFKYPNDEVDIDQLYSADKVSVDALLVGIIKN